VESNEKLDKEISFLKEENQKIKEKNEDFKRNF